MSRRREYADSIAGSTPGETNLPIGLLDVVGAVSPMSLVGLLGDPFNPTEAMAGEEELLAKYRSGEIASVFPQPKRLGGGQFGRYLQMPNKLDITDNIYEGGYIDTKSSKPKLRVARQYTNDPINFKSTPGTRILTNLYKNPPISYRPSIMAEDGRFIISNEFRGGDKIPGLFNKSGDHIYSLETHFDSPVQLSRDEGKVRSALKAIEEGRKLPSEPYLRPRSVGAIELGQQVGEMKSVSGPKPIFDKLLMYLPKKYFRGGF